MATLAPDVTAVIDEGLARDGLVVVLTGAGISAESGIPTFRGPEGYWTVGSVEYRPEELATAATFRRQPEEVWAWYLYRLGVCRAAEPNTAHAALAVAEHALGQRFQLITQNVDGLHRRAGSRRCYAVHGDLERVRCAQACGVGLQPLPPSVAPKARGEGLTEAEHAALTCQACGGWLRPLVLWFDETYNEEWFRFDSALRVAADTALLVTVGTSGATTLPALVVQQAVHAGAALVDCNPEDNPVAELADRIEHGAAVRAPASEAVPAIVEHITRALH